MRREFKRAALAGVFLLGASFTAQAADIGRSAPMPAYKAPALVPAYSWTGFYAGINGGYMFGDGNISSFDGGLFGGTLGYNYQPIGSNIVFGIEGDIGWSNFGTSATATAGGVTVTARSEAELFATLRGRLGWAMDRWLVYATAGGAWLRNEISLTATAGGLVAGISDTQNHFGYTVGAGIEYAFLPNWSGKLEYLYSGLEGETYFGVARTSDLDIHTIRGGVNYRFVAR
jgi:outer membrane immunogenic protein